MISIKIHDSENGNIIALCDDELLGKKFKEGATELDLDTYGNFYKENTVSEDDVFLMFGDIGFYSVNAVGQRSVDILIRAKYIEKAQVSTIGGIPTVQIYRMVD